MVLNLPPNISISDDIKVLLNLMFKEGIKTNKGTLTIYPSGAYESEFIWDNEAYLKHLAQRAEIWLSLIFNEAYYRIQDRCDVLSIEWDFTTEVVVTFTNGISNPVLFITENNPIMTFSLFLEQVFFYMENDYVEEFEAYAKVRKVDSDFVMRDTEFYLMLNEGELKGRYPRWNVMRFTVNPKSEPIFEWREENA